MSENVTYFSERLWKALEAMLKSPLTVVEAPMGYGKSVAVEAFLRASPVRRVVTRAQETAPEYFWSDFCRALAAELPESQKISASLARLGLPHDLAQTNAALELFRQVDFTQATVLVFDDCHFLPRSFVDFCESLAGEALPNLMVVCVTRHAWAHHFLPPGHAPSRIDQKVFALNPLEIRAYFARCGVSLSLNAAEELEAKTGGWISALYLGLLWHKEHGDFLSFPKNVAAQMKETIEKTVYASLSAQTKEMLFTLAPLERFSAEQVERLYGETVLLEELVRKNAFAAYDAKSRLYSLHPIFRQFLLDIFAEDGVLPEARRREIYFSCGDALKDAGELAAAMECWYKAGAFERALTVLESDMTRNLVTERAALYTAMFKDCPQEILERHRGAAFKYAIAAFSAGDYQALATQLQWLTAQCAALPGDEGAPWRGELHVLLALAAFNDIEAMSGHHRRALELLKGPTRLYGPDSPWTLGSPSVLFMFYRESGKLADELRQMRECMPPYYRLTSRHGAGAEFLMEAEALYNAGDFAKAGEACTLGLGMAERHAQLGNEFCALFLRMRLALIEGDAPALFGNGEDGLIATMRGLIARGRDYYLLHTADLCEGWLYAALGLYDRIPLWLRSELSDESRLYAFAKGYYFIVHGRALLLAGEDARLIGLFTGVLRAGAFAKNLLFSVYAHVYLAAAFARTDKPEEAVSALKIALDSALPDALLMPFAENHDLIGAVLTKACGRKQHGALSRIKALAKEMKAGRKAVLEELHARELLGSAIREDGEVDLGKFYAFVVHHRLTRREAEVLLHILRKLSVKEMAERLNLSTRGITAHISEILGKTGVRTRWDLLPLYVAWDARK